MIQLKGFEGIWNERAYRVAFESKNPCNIVAKWEEIEVLFERCAAPLLSWLLTHPNGRHSLLTVMTHYSSDKFKLNLFQVYIC